MLSILLGNNLGVKLLGHMATLFKFLKDSQIIFQSGWATSHPHQFLYILANVCYCSIISFHTELFSYPEQELIEYQGL